MRHTELVIIACCSLLAGCLHRPSALPRASARISPQSCSVAALGVETVAATPSLRQAHLLPRGEVGGTLAVEILAGSPAEAAGLAVGDLIETVGGRRPFALSGGFFLEMSCATPIEVAVVRGAARRTVILVPEEAGPLLEASCTRGQLSACYRRAWLWRHGTGGPVDPEHVAALLTSTCRGGFGAACAELAALRDQEPNQAAAAATLLARACALGDASACASVAYRRWYDSRDTADAGRATELLLASCRAGNVMDCQAAGKMLIWNPGIGAPPTAADVFAEACEGGSATACVDLGELLEAGQHVPPSLAAAVGFYDRARTSASCPTIDRNACHDLGLPAAGEEGIGPAAFRASRLLLSMCGRPRDDASPQDASALDAACSALAGAGSDHEGIAQLSRLAARVTSLADGPVDLMASTEYRELVEQLYGAVADRCIALLGSRGDVAARHLEDHLGLLGVFAVAVRLPGKSPAFVVTPAWDWSGAAFAISQADGQWSVTWRIEQGVDASGSHPPELDHWIPGPPGYHDGPMDGTVHVLPASPAGHPRFHIDALSLPGMGLERPGQISVWEWTGTTARSLFVADYRTHYCAHAVALRGADLVIEVAEQYETFFNCGSCAPGPTASWTLRIAPTGPQDCGVVPHEPEFRLADRLLAAVHRGGETATLASAEVAAELKAFFAKHQAPGSVSLGMGYPRRWTENGQTVVGVRTDDYDITLWFAEAAGGMVATRAVARYMPQE
ncbi:MAG: hypothetical protein HYV63_22290 [Candidatus Schekmanbacteria bacterium]|nr:hypothetical protein [Candidatus Schekmanbacteria bacterium]